MKNGLGQTCVNDGYAKCSGSRYEPNGYGLV